MNCDNFTNDVDMFSVVPLSHKLLEHTYLSNSN